MHTAGTPLVFAKPLEALVDHFGFSLFTSYLNLFGLSLIALLLLAMEVNLNTLCGHQAWIVSFAWRFCNPPHSHGSYCCQ